MSPDFTVIIVGRENVGKSSLVNRLLKTDRVIVSAIPGTTVDSIDIPFALGKGPAHLDQQTFGVRGGAHGDPRREALLEHGVAGGIETLAHGQLRGAGTRCAAPRDAPAVPPPCRDRCGR